MLKLATEREALLMKKILPRYAERVQEAYHAGRAAGGPTHNHTLVRQACSSSSSFCDVV
jgi:hypothetical protein